MSHFLAYLICAMPKRKEKQPSPADCLFHQTQLLNSFINIFILTLLFRASQLSSCCLMAVLQVGLAVVNGQLMAVGGFDGTTYLKTIEVFDPDANTWR